SSRRRHTRFSRDWSSDVCSSDLERLNVLVVDADRRFVEDQHFRFGDQRPGNEYPLLLSTGKFTDAAVAEAFHADRLQRFADRFLDRKSTRLNSSHVKISYAVFCL